MGGETIEPLAPVAGRCVRCAAPVQFTLASAGVFRATSSAIRMAAVGLLLTLCGQSLFASNVEEPKRVLIPYSVDKEEAVHAGLDLALRSTLGSQVYERVEFYTEYLDLIRFLDHTHARWGIGEKLLPSGTRIPHNEPSLWERYPDYIIGLIVVLAVQICLIIFLLLERRKRRRTEEQFRSEKAFSDALFEALPGVVIVQDEKGNNIRWNQNAERVRRFHPRTNGYLANVADESKPLARQLVQEVFKNGTAQGELEFLAKEGRTTPFHMSAVRMELEGKRFFIASGIDISKRKRAEEELRLSEERFSAAFEHAPIGVALATPGGRYIKVNLALCQILGYSATELQAKTRSEITHPDDLEDDDERIRQMLAGDRSFQMRDKRYLHQSGRVVWASVSISLVRDKEGQPSYFIVEVQDITGRKKIEESLRAIVEGVPSGSSADFFSSMALQLSKATGAEHAIIGELVEEGEPVIRPLGACSNRTIVEGVTYKLAGTPSEDAIRKRTCSSYPNDVADRFPDSDFLRQMKVQGYVGIPLFDSQKRVLGIMAAMFTAPIENPQFVESVLQVFSNWTAAEIIRSRAESELRLAEERFSTAFRCSPMAFAITTMRDQRFIEANDAFLNLLGYARSKVIGNTVDRLNIWVDPVERVLLLAKVNEVGQAREEAVRFRTKSGSILQIRMSAELVQIQNEMCLLGLARDVTEQNLMEEQFRQAQKMEAMGRLAGGVAHDFNNLLGVIIGYSELLSSGAPKNSVFLKRVEGIKQAAQRAASLTTQLLAYSRKQNLDPRVININSLVAETERLLQPLIGEDVNLKIVQAPKLGHVTADAGQMVQVIMNLAVNARDAMPNGGTLTIETANVHIEEKTHLPIQPGAYVRLAVIDNGTGMTERTKTRIFEPFYTTKPKGQGTGLGLATVYGIVEQSGGIILVESELGIGTTFEIYLPRVDDAVEGAVLQMPSAEPERTSGTILLVEDEVALQRVVNEGLTEEGYRVLLAGNAEDARRIAEQYDGPIQLLITDIILPAMSGPELVQSLVVSRPEIRVLYMSGYPADKLTRFPKLDPNIPLLRKPFKLAELGQKVRDLMNGNVASTKRAKKQRSGL